MAALGSWSWVFLLASGCDCTTLRNSGWTLGSTLSVSEPAADGLCPPGTVLERWSNGGNYAVAGRVSKCRPIAGCDTGVTGSGATRMKRLICTTGANLDLQCASKAVSAGSSL
jgi:hypothetical protein